MIVETHRYEDIEISKVQRPREREYWRLTARNSSSQVSGSSGRRLDQGKIERIASRAARRRSKDKCGFRIIIILLIIIKILFNFVINFA